MIIKPLTREKIFIPEFNGNKDLGDSEQIKVHITKFPTTTETGNYKKLSFGSSDSSVSITYGNDAIMLQKHVGNIENLMIEGIGQIANGKALGASEELILADLVGEIRAYLLDAAELLEPGEK